jgi:hypothetical protein
MSQLRSEVFKHIAGRRDCRHKGLGMGESKERYRN